MHKKKCTYVCIVFVHTYIPAHSQYGSYIVHIVTSPFMKQHIAGQTLHNLHSSHLIGASRLWATVTMTSVPKTQKISYKKSPPNRMKPAFTLRGRGGVRGRGKGRVRVREQTGKGKGQRKGEGGRGDALVRQTRKGVKD